MTITKQLLVVKLPLDLAHRVHEIAAELGVTVDAVVEDMVRGMLRLNERGVRG